MILIENIAIIGAGGLGREVAEVIKFSNNPQQKVIGFIDDDPKKQNTVINGYPVLGGIDWLESCEINNIHVVCGIGNNETRKRIAMKIKEFQIPFSTVIHSSTHIGESVKIGEGTIICAGNIITCNIDIGKHVYINLDCTIGHDTILEDYVNLSPGVHVSGNVVLKKGCHIFTGTVIIPDVVIGEWTTIGAGAVVLKNIEDNCVAVGVPAKVIKKREY